MFRVSFWDAGTLSTVEEAQLPALSSVKEMVLESMLMVYLWPAPWPVTAILWAGTALSEAAISWASSMVVLVRWYSLSSLIWRVPSETTVSTYTLLMFQSVTVVPFTWSTSLLTEVMSPMLSMNRSLELGRNMLAGSLCWALSMVVSEFTASTPGDWADLFR